ncbi:hypothetical protein SAMD00019534_033740 [Acytostelium subglobosum LB1]|uniref:hypothetical protein n=1 Tax=Acytostelium subglobosum LB1 TaxID=1410327 RepID=UPI0006449B14|nr:hypothetical protein SAMD00019534_033740 [Acytostelium subglobosum LB1]GAM20199.1 hypothetical protein SAMD00019534_033740 [Acytostelium subglobosum LB1]|eukprot:XP_012759720.1 hypothetical protein SAMD00019534_033740 [Acytostelium subglobosum LB1]
MLVDEDAKLEEEKLRGIAKKLWIVGFFFLPWIWLINVLFFIPYRKVITPQITWYLRFSLIGFFVYSGIFMAWMGIYLTHWTSWGTMGDKISIVIPYGSA